MSLQPKWGLFISVLVTLLLAASSLANASWVRATTAIDAYDREVDLIVVGYGLAGAAAAVEAYDLDPSADIVILEKMPAELAGGNSRASGQTFLVPHEDDLETFKTYIRMCNEPNPIPEEYLDWWAHEMAAQLHWIEEFVADIDYELGYVGGGPLRWGDLVVEFEDFPGADFVGASAHLREAGSGGFEIGGVWNAFHEGVQSRGIPVEYQMPAVALIQDPLTREVAGVVAEDWAGNEITIRARQGVVLACGGFENDLQMQRDFHGMDQVYTTGTPGNTGDGIKMLMEAGAQLWHMKNQTQSGGFWLGIKVPDFESAFIRQMVFRTGSWIEIDAAGERFYDEAQTYHRQHMKHIQHGKYADLPHWKALPVHLIFDDYTRENNTIITPWLSWPVSIEGYRWSRDNQVEIDKGWVMQADTIEELALLTDREPTELQATIDRWNEMAESGTDEDFGRDPEMMRPISEPPYYAVELFPALVATTGGAKRNPYSQALNWEDEPIARLYTAGQLGSYVSNLYQNGIFLSEAIMSGRAAAQHALSLDPAE